MDLLGCAGGRGGAGDGQPSMLDAEPLVVSSGVPRLGLARPTSLTPTRGQKPVRTPSQHQQARRHMFVQAAEPPVYVQYILFTQTAIETRIACRCIRLPYCTSQLLYLHAV